MQAWRSNRRLFHVFPRPKHHPRIRLSPAQGCAFASRDPATRNTAVPLSALTPGGPGWHFPTALARRRGHDPSQNPLETDTQPVSPPAQKASLSARPALGLLRPGPSSPDRPMLKLVWPRPRTVTSGDRASGLAPTSSVAACSAAWCSVVRRAIAARDARVDLSSRLVSHGSPRRPRCPRPRLPQPCRGRKRPGSWTLVVT